MGLAKNSGLDNGFLCNLAFLHQQNKQHFYCKVSPSKGKPVSWTVVCGLMLFVLGLISLFTGHVASDLELYSQRLVKRSLYYKLSRTNRAPVDIWKSRISKFYYGCSERGPHFSRSLKYDVAFVRLVSVASEVASLKHDVSTGKPVARSWWNQDLDQLCERRKAELMGLWSVSYSRSSYTSSSTNYNSTPEIEIDLLGFLNGR